MSGYPPQDDATPGPDDATPGPDDETPGPNNTALYIGLGVAAVLALLLWLVFGVFSGDDDTTVDDASETESESVEEESSEEESSEEESSEEESSEEESSEEAEPSESETDDGGTVAPGEGPEVTVASFNFTESIILAEIYAQALEDAGYEIDRQLELGSREVIFPELTTGAIDFLPEYVGSALTVGFGGEATSDLDETLEALAEEFAAVGVVVLEPAPGEDKNVYVVTGDFSETNSVTSIPDLADVGDITLGGPPECETRENCFLGLTGDPYNLTNLSFEAIPEGSVRVASLENGEIEVATLFSTQPVISELGFVVLDDPEGIVAVENIVPVVSQEVADAYGQDMVDLVNAISAEITTEVLLDLNGRVEIDAEDPADVAGDWLEENDLLG